MVQRETVVGCLIGLLTHFALGADDPLAVAREELSKLDEVSGSAVGFAGQAGAFYTLQGEFLHHGEEKIFADLLASDHAVTRAMGLCCIAERGGPGAAEILIAHLEGAQTFLYMPGGCVGWWFTEGALALTLLQHGNALDGTPSGGLMEEDDLRQLAFKFLARDQAYFIHGELLQILVMSGCPENYSELARETPDLSEMERVKAVGRFEPSGLVSRLLMEVLGDEQRSLEARLAAASGLSRSQFPDPRSILQEAEVFSGLVNGEALRAEMIGIVDQVGAQSKREYRIEAVRTWRGMEKIEAVVVAANSVPHPLVLPMISRTRGKAIWGSHKSVRDAQLNTLKGLARDMERSRQTWNTWSDTPYLMDQFLTDTIEGEHSDLTEEEHAAWTAVRESIQTFLKKPR